MPYRSSHVVELPCSQSQSRSVQRKQFPINQVVTKAASVIMRRTHPPKGNGSPARLTTGETCLHYSLVGSRQVCLKSWAFVSSQPSFFFHLTPTPLPHRFCFLLALPPCGSRNVTLRTVRSSQLLLLSLHGRLPIYLPFISRSALAKSLPSRKLTNP